MDGTAALLAIEAIKVLKARYFRYVDIKNWDGFRTLFTDDATLFFPENEAKPSSIADFIDHVPAVLAGCVSVHHGFMPEITVLSAHTARAIWAMDDYLWFPPGATGLAGAAEIRGAGHYHESYVRQNDSWLIKTLVLTRLKLDLVPRSRTVALPPSATQAQPRNN